MIIGDNVNFWTQNNTFLETAFLMSQEYENERINSHIFLKTGVDPSAQVKIHRAIYSMSNDTIWGHPPEYLLYTY